MQLHLITSWRRSGWGRKFWGSGGGGVFFIKHNYCRAQIQSERLEVELLLQKVQEAFGGNTIGSADKSVWANKVIQKTPGMPSFA